EQLPCRAFGDAGAPVANVEHRGAAGVAVDVQGDAGGFAGYAAVGQGVVHQDDQDLVQLARVDQGGGAGLAGGGAQFVVFQRVGAAVFVDETAGERGQFDVFGLGRFAPGQAQDVLDDAVHALALLVDDLQQAAVGGLDVLGLLHQLDGVVDRRQ